MSEIKKEWVELVTQQLVFLSSAVAALSEEVAKLREDRT